jgi:hypothetical protein
MHPPFSLKVSSILSDLPSFAASDHLHADAKLATVFSVSVLGTLSVCLSACVWFRVGLSVCRRASTGAFLMCLSGCVYICEVSA